MPEAYPGPIQSSSYLCSFSQKSNLILSSTPMTCKRATNTTLSGMIHSEVNFYWPVLSGNGKTTYLIKWFILNASCFSTKLHGHMGWTFSQSPKLPWNFLITGRLLLLNLYQNSWCVLSSHISTNYSSGSKFFSCCRTPWKKIFIVS